MYKVTRLVLLGLDGLVAMKQEDSRPAVYA